MTTRSWIEGSLSTLFVLALFIGACTSTTGNGDERVGGETHWLGGCRTDADCDRGACLCGVCTAACTNAAPCDSDAVCVATTGAVLGGLCTGAQGSVCLATCDGDGACPAGTTCRSGACISALVSTAGAGGAAGAGGEASQGGGGGTGGTPSAGSGGQMPSAGTGGASASAPDGGGAGATSTGPVVIDAGLCGRDAATLVSTAGVFIGHADSLRRELAAACAGLAEATVPAAVTDDDVATLCDAASTRLAEAYAAAGNVGIAVGDPLCAVDAAALFDCEAGCQAAAGCDCPAPSLEARCGSGLFGSCAGECSGECTATVGDGVWCAGRCEGQCEGQCDANCDVAGQGGCIGACDGTCSGFCRGTCAVQAEACTATCQGQCSTAFDGLGCAEPLTPSACGCAIQCVTACEGLDAYGAECSAGNVSVSPSAVIDTSVANAVRTHLPEVARVLSAVELSLGAMGGLVTSVGLLPSELAASCMAAHGADIAATVEATAEASASINVLAQSAAAVMGAVLG